VKIKTCGKEKRRQEWGETCRHESPIGGTGLSVGKPTDKVYAFVEREQSNMSEFQELSFVAR